MANHVSATAHHTNIAHYIITEIGHMAMLGLFDHSPFTPWCQINPLLTRPKKDSTSRSLIMALSSPLPPGSSVSGGTPKDTYLGVPKKIRHPSGLDLASLIREAGRGAWLFSCDVSRADRSSPFDPADWPLVCFLEGVGFSWMLASLSASRGQHHHVGYYLHHHQPPQQSGVQSAQLYR